MSEEIRQLLQEINKITIAKAEEDSKPFGELAERIRQGLAAVSSEVATRSAKQCEEAVSQALSVESKALEVLAKQRDEYNNLLKREMELKKECEKMEESLEDMDGKIEEYTKKASSLELTYQAEKKALTIAKNKYESCFGISVTTVEGGDTVYKSKIAFNENTDFFAVLTIDREQKKLLDIDAPAQFISKSELEELKAAYNETNNTLAVLVKLKEFALKKNSKE